MDVDAELLDMAIEIAQDFLPEILNDLAASKNKHASLLANTIKEQIVHLPESKRAEAVSSLNLWIDTHANGHAATLRDLLGLPDEHISAAGIDVREAVIAQALDAAAATDDIRRRDDLIAAAVRHLARLNNPLAVERWKKNLLKLGVTTNTLQQMLKQVAGDDGDPIRALINEAANETDQDAALRKLFDSLSNLNAFELIRYVNEVQQRLGISGVMFDRMLTQARKIKSRAEIIDGQLCDQGEVLANWSAMITHQRTLNDGMNQPSVTYSVLGTLANGKALPAIDIKADEFEDVRQWVPGHWGADPIAYVPPAQMYRIARAIKDHSRNNGMKRETLYTFTGWATIGGKRAYLTAGGAINADGLDPNVTVDLGHNRLNFYCLPEPPEGKALKQAAKASLEFLYLAPLRITAPLWAAIYGAPLIEEFSLNSMLWVYGPTQSGKSTITMLALTHLGEKFVKGREYYSPCDWVSTVTDIEHNMFTIKDAPLVIDDYAPQSSSDGERDMRKKVERTVRTLGNRAGRGRRNADGSARRLSPPRGLVISTAELPLDVQSIVGRMIYVPVEQTQILGVSEDIDEHQRRAGVGGGAYAQAFAGYVRWLAANWDQAITEAKADHERASHYARGVFPSSQSRMVDYYANLITYANTGTRYLQAAGVVTPSEAQDMREQKFPGAFVELLKMQSVRVAEQSPVLRMLEALESKLMTGGAHFELRLGSSTPPPQGSTVVGYYEDNNLKAGGPVLFLITGNCLQLSRDYWQKAGSNFNATKDSLQRQIDQADVLAYRPEGQIETTEWIGGLGRTTRLVAVDPAKLAEKFGVDIWPGGRGDDQKPLRCKSHQ